MLRSYDEVELLRRLSSLTPVGRSAFALCCSLRLFPGYLSWHREVGTIPDRRVGDLLALLEGQFLGRARGAGAELHWVDVETLLDLMPSENSTWSQSWPIAEDAVACLAYTLRSVHRSDPKEAAWAARHAYESADQLAILDLEDGSPGFPHEQALQKHPSVQQELERQERDFALISKGEMAAAINLAKAASIFDRE